jgi:hypothetical protein
MSNNEIEGTPVAFWQAAPAGDEDSARNDFQSLPD